MHSLDSGNDKVVLVGASAGGMNALGILLSHLPAHFPWPVVVVQHLDPLQDGFLAEYFNRISSLLVKEVEDKECTIPGVCYLTPPDYHLLCERDRSLALSSDEKVNFSRPSIDLLFESAAAAFGPDAVAVLLTGASRDGSEGLLEIRSTGGLAIVQNPATAEFPFMPRAALSTAGADHILDIEDIGPFLVRLAAGESGK